MNILVPLHFHVLPHGYLVAHGLLAAGSNYHGLGLTIQQVAHIGAEVLNNDLNTLGNVIRVQAHPLGQRT